MVLNIKQLYIACFKFSSFILLELLGTGVTFGKFTSCWKLLTKENYYEVHFSTDTSTGHHKVPSLLKISGTSSSLTEFFCVSDLFVQATT